MLGKRLVGESGAAQLAEPEQTATNPARGLIYANVAVIFFGVAGVLGKLSGLSSPLITLGRVLFAGVVLLVAARLRGEARLPRNRRDAAILIGQGVILALHWTSFFESINRSNVAIGLLSFSSFPLFTAALEPLLLRQKPSRVQIVAALLVLPGIYLLVPSFSMEDSTSVGVAWGLFSGATFALLSVLNRWLGRSYPSLTISLYQDSVAALVLLPLVLLVPATVNWTLEAVLILVVLGVGCTALAHTIFIESMRDITAQTASLLASLEPVWGIAFGIVLLGEVPTTRTLAGGAVILLATLLPALVGLGKARRKRANPAPT